MSSVAGIIFGGQMSIIWSLWVKAANFRHCHLILFLPHDSTWQITSDTHCLRLKMYLCNAADGTVLTETMLKCTLVIHCHPLLLYRNVYSTSRHMVDATEFICDIHIGILPPDDTHLVVFTCDISMLFEGHICYWHMSGNNIVKLLFFGDWYKQHFGVCM